MRVNVNLMKRHDITLLEKWDVKCLYSFLVGGDHVLQIL